MSARVCMTMAVLCSVTTACAFDSGQGFATLGDGELIATSDNRVLTDRGYEMSVSAFALRVREIEFQELQSGVGDVCADDHCHADEEAPAVEPDVGATYTTRAHARVGRTLDALEGDVVALASFEPSRELSAGSLDRAEVRIGSMRVEAEVTGGDLKAPWSLVLAAPLDATLRTALDRHIDRDEPQDIEPHVAITFSGTVFDGVDFAKLAAMAPEELDAMAAELLTDALGRATLEVDFGGDEHEHDH